MGRIAVLPPAVQAQIAAGEVIERPASVVKELAENALDAGARTIDVRLAGGGLDAIVVRDDGEGMAPDDAVLAFARHATSKLTALDDLLCVRTLGFRGEALASVAAVAQVRVVTRRASDASAAAVEADVEGARGAGQAGAPPGTEITVRDLFATTPARRKFLRSPATEAGHAAEALTRLAVAHPRAGFRLEHDGRELLHVPPVADVRQRLVQILGRARAAALVEVEAAADGYTLAGFVGLPRETLATARLVWTYVVLDPPGGARAGGRWVRDRLLLRAVIDGYASLLLRGRYPMAILFLGVPAGEVDVNVHPAKLEVRFRRSAAVHRLVVPAVRARLAAALAAAPVATTSVGAGAGLAAAEPPRDVVAWGGTDGGLAVAAAECVGEGRSEWPKAVPAMPFASAPLWTAEPGGFRNLRFLGQLFHGYLVCEGEGRVVLVDQHAAHERVEFERLRAEAARSGVARDTLLVPETVRLPPEHVALLGEHVAALAEAGLEGEPFGADTFLLRTVPRLLHGRDVGKLLAAVADELAEEGASDAVGRAVEAVLATVACHAVVRVGQRLDGAEARALLESMDAVPIAAHCPHGRPVAAELSRVQLEGLFRR